MRVPQLQAVGARGGLAALARGFARLERREAAPEVVEHGRGRGA